MKKIGVLSSGGDSPGMNAAIRAVVRTAIYYNIEVIGIKRGYQGLIDKKLEAMGTTSVSNIIQRGGTILKSARCEEFKTKEGRAKAYQTLQENNIDGLVVIGGDGTYTGANMLYQEFGIPVIGLPGTIDNDLYGTDFTIGYDTAVNTALNAIDKIRDTADSHDRMFFVEVMGRDTGFIAIDVGISGGAEAILVPEIHTNMDHLINSISEGVNRKKSSQLVVVAEGDDAGGVFDVMEKVKAQLPFMDCRAVVLGHIQRGGSPTARDRVRASVLGASAVEALIKGKKCEAIGIVDNQVFYCSLQDAIEKKKDVNMDLLRLATIPSL